VLPDRLVGSSAAGIRTAATPEGGAANIQRPAGTALVAQEETRGAYQFIHPTTMGFSHLARSVSDWRVRRWIRSPWSTVLLALSASVLIAGRNQM
jgi:hypothetical protein